MELHPTYFSILVEADSYCHVENMVKTVEVDGIRFCILQKASIVIEKKFKKVILGPHEAVKLLAIENAISDPFIAPQFETETEDIILTFFCSKMAKQQIDCKKMTLLYHAIDKITFF